MTNPTPPKTGHKGPVQGTLRTDDDVPILVQLSDDQQFVLVAGPQDSVRIPVHSLYTTIDETGPAARQVAADAKLQHLDQISPGLVQVEEGHRVVINGLTYEVVDIHDNTGEFQLTVKPFQR